MPTGRIAVSTIQSARVGIESRNSMTRCMPLSMAPPKYPETVPSTPPRIVEMSTATTPTVSDTWAPVRMRPSMSRPSSSVPRRYIL
jgi:hypothetical protein